MPPIVSRETPRTAPHRSSSPTAHVSRGTVRCSPPPRSCRERTFHVKQSGGRSGRNALFTPRSESTEGEAPRHRAHTTPPSAAPKSRRRVWYVRVGVCEYGRGRYHQPSYHRCQERSSAVGYAHTPKPTPVPGRSSERSGGAFPRIQKQDRQTATGVSRETSATLSPGTAHARVGTNLPFRGARRGDCKREKSIPSAPPSAAPLLPMKGGRPFGVWAFGHGRMGERERGRKRGCAFAPRPLAPSPFRPLPYALSQREKRSRANVRTRG